MKDTISQKLKSKLEEMNLTELRAGHKAHPEASVAPITTQDGNGGSSKYDKIVKILENPIINTAAICELVLGDKEGTNRSLFRKKLYREEDHEFDDTEIQKIESALMNFSTTIRKTIGRQGKA